MNALWIGGDFLDNVIFGDAQELTWIREEEGIWTEGTHGLRHGSCTRVCLLIVTLFGVSLLSSRTGGSISHSGQEKPQVTTRFSSKDMFVSQSL